MQETKSDVEHAASQPQRQPLQTVMANIAMNMTAEPITAKATTKPKSASKPTAVPKTASSSKKRTIAETEEPTITIEESDFDKPIFQHITDDCNQIRRKINIFINNGGMKVGAFQDAIQTNSRSYSMFMKQSGRDAGAYSNVYHSAFIFFKKRELAGMSMPRKKAKPTAAKALYDVADVHIAGEEKDDVPIFDTCDDVRRKISAHLREPDVTQAAFLKAAAACFTAHKKLQNKQLQDFLGKSGPSAGNSSGVYYAAYVLFEKMRIKAGKEKSAKRVEMEKIWKNKGMDKERGSGGYWCGPNEALVEDAYGRLTFQRYR